MWLTACPDWEDRILEGPKGRGLVPDLPLFQTQAERALRIFKRLRLPDVIGTPRMEVASGEWFFPIVAALFGSYDAETNERMIKEIFLLIPKKNGKTSYSAAIMVVAIIMNIRPQAEFLLIAPTKAIADIAFKQALGIIRLDPELVKLFDPKPHFRTIIHRLTGATILVQAADTDAITGSKSTGILIDETHVFAEKSRAADVFLEIRGALTSRPDGFLIQITTQSKRQPAGVFKAELENARDVRDGKLLLPRLTVAYELPDRILENNGWRDEKYWPLVNPNMGRSVSADFLKDQLLTADRAGPAQLALLASQHFNVEIGVRLKTDAWRGAEFWEACADPDLSALSSIEALKEILRRCDLVTCGVDGGGLDDMLALAVIGRERKTGRQLLWTKAWLHQSVLDLRKTEAARFRDFAEEGDLSIVANLDDAFDELVKLVLMIDDTEILAQIGFDPYGVGIIIQKLEDEGIDRDSRMPGVPQGYKLNGTIKTAEVKLSDKTLLHCGRPMMNWVVGNAKIVISGSNILITKQASGTGKIDPLMAAFNAIALMTMNPEAGGTVYEDEEFMV